MATISNISVMVVDDEPAIREVFKHFLAGRGHQVVTCGTGKEALQNAQRSHFDVIVLDALLPDMSGVDLVDELKSISANARIIFLTGTQSDEIENSARQREIFDYLSKPIRASALMEVVEAAGSLPPTALPS
jgi:CheY-like chemotaxis protein